jgi:hypothetical protein
MEMIYYGCYPLDYATHIHGQYHVLKGIEVLLMKVNENCEDEHEGQRG